MLDCPNCGGNNIALNGSKKKYDTNRIIRYHACSDCGIGWPSEQKPGKIYYTIRENMNLHKKST